MNDLNGYKWNPYERYKRRRNWVIGGYVALLLVVLAVGGGTADPNMRLPFALAFLLLLLGLIPLGIVIHRKTREVERRYHIEREPYQVWAKRLPWLLLLLLGVGVAVILTMLLTSGGDAKSPAIEGFTYALIALVIVALFAVAPLKNWLERKGEALRLERTLGALFQRAQGGDRDAALKFDYLLDGLPLANLRALCAERGGQAAVSLGWRRYATRRNRLVLGYALLSVASFALLPVATENDMEVLVNIASALYLLCALLLIPLIIYAFVLTRRARVQDAEDREALRRALNGLLRSYEGPEGDWPQQSGQYPGPRE